MAKRSMVLAGLFGNLSLKYGKCSSDGVQMPGISYFFISSPSCIGQDRLAAGRNRLNSDWEMQLEPNRNTIQKALATPRVQR